MSIEVNKATVRRLYDEFWNAGKLEVAHELLHPDYVFAEGYGAGAPSVEASKEAVLFWHRVLHDMHFTIDDMIAEDDTVVVRWTACGTHQGDWEMELGTIPASGKATTTPGTSTIYLRDAKIIRDVDHVHFVSLLQQIRSFFSQFIASSPPELLKAMTLTHQAVTGEIAYITWKAEPFIPFASDTFLIRDDTIVVQTGTLAS